MAGTFVFAAPFDAGFCNLMPAIPVQFSLSR
jgi:hypothetical protein